MTSEIVRIKDAKEYKENPFLTEGNIPIVPKSNMYVNKDEGLIKLADKELKNDLCLMGTNKYVDGEEFGKTFIKELHQIFDLSKASQRVFAYMLSKVKYDHLIMIDMKECLQKTGYRSKGPIFKSVAELIQKEFIAKTKNQFVYWTNPKIFYKGDRLVVIREYRKAKKEQAKTTNQLDSV